MFLCLTDLEVHLYRKRTLITLISLLFFFANLGVSIIIYIIIFALAPYVAEFYSMPVMKAALRVLGIRVIVAAINSVQQAYVSKYMMFQRFFWSTLFGTIFSGVVAFSWRTMVLEFGH